MDTKLIWRIKHEKTEKSCVKFWCSFYSLYFTGCKTWFTKCHLIRGGRGKLSSEEWDACTFPASSVCNFIPRASKPGLLIGIIPLFTCSPLILFSKDKCLFNKQNDFFFSLLICVPWWVFLTSCVPFTLLVFFATFLPSFFSAWLIVRYSSSLWLQRWTLISPIQWTHGITLTTTIGQGDTSSNSSQGNWQEKFISSCLRVRVSLSCETETKRYMAPVAPVAYFEHEFLKTPGDTDHKEPESRLPIHENTHISLVFKPPRARFLIFAAQNILNRYKIWCIFSSKHWASEGYVE